MRKEKQKFKINSHCVKKLVRPDFPELQVERKMKCRVYVVSKATPRVDKTSQIRYICIWGKKIEMMKSKMNYNEVDDGRGGAFWDPERETKARVRKSEAGVLMNWIDQRCWRER